MSLSLSTDDAVLSSSSGSPLPSMTAKPGVYSSKPPIVIALALLLGLLVVLVANIVFWWWYFRKRRVNGFGKHMMNYDSECRPEYAAPTIRIETAAYSDSTGMFKRVSGGGRDHMTPHGETPFEELSRWRWPAVELSSPAPPPDIAISPVARRRATSPPYRHKNASPHPSSLRVISADELTAAYGMPYGQQHSDSPPPFSRLIPTPPQLQSRLARPRGPRSPLSDASC